MAKKKTYNFENYSFKDDRFRNIFDQLLKNLKYLYNARSFFNRIDLDKKFITSVIQNEKIFNCFKNSLSNLDSDFLMSLKDLTKEVSPEEPWEMTYITQNIPTIIEFINKRDQILSSDYRKFLTKKSGRESFLEIYKICDHLTLALSLITTWLLRMFSTNYERGYEDWWDIEYNNPEKEHLEVLTRCLDDYDLRPLLGLVKGALGEECIKWYDYFYKKDFEK